DQQAAVIDQIEERQQRRAQQLGELAAERELAPRQDHLVVEALAQPRTRQPIATAHQHEPLEHIAVEHEAVELRRRGLVGVDEAVAAALVRALEQRDRDALVVQRLLAERRVDVEVHALILARTMPNSRSVMIASSRLSTQT